MWVKPTAAEVLRESSMKTEATYIGISQGMLAQWLDLITIFEVCARDQGFVGGVVVEEIIVAKRGAIGGYQGHSGGGLTGGASQEEITGP